jgi:xanthine/uracil permease
MAMKRTVYVHHYSGRTLVLGVATVTLGFIPTVFASSLGISITAGMCIGCALSWALCYQSFESLEKDQHDFRHLNHWYTVY